MNYFDYFQVITLIVFLMGFFGRTIWLRRKGTKIFVIGSGKKGFAAFLIERYGDKCRKYMAQVNRYI